MDRKGMAGRATFGIFVLCSGITFLMNTLGYLPWSVWHDLVPWWPVLLILAGINVIFERTAAWPVVILSPLVVAAVFAMVIAADMGVISDWPEDSKLVFSHRKHEAVETVFTAKPEEGREVKKVSLVVSLASAEFALSSAPEAEIGAIVKVDAETTRPLPKFKEDYSGDKLKVSLSQEDEFGRHFDSKEKYKVELAEEYPYEMELNFGAGKFDLDLSGMLCRSLQLNTGAADADIILPSGDASSPDIEINGGASSIKVKVPRGVAVKLDKNGLVSVTARKLATLPDGSYAVEGQDADALHTVNLTINNAVGSVELSPYEEKVDVESSGDTPDAENAPEDTSPDSAPSSV